MKHVTILQVFQFNSISIFLNGSVMSMQICNSPTHYFVNSNILLPKKQITDKNCRNNSHEISKKPAGNCVASVSDAD